MDLGAAAASLDQHDVGRLAEPSTSRCALHALDVRDSPSLSLHIVVLALVLALALPLALPLA
eukprot:CAMPEP_0119481322 /NCGR_PEP_ID=MMETSP1344-20130328/9721_1 /TAXON_ID=236787 /ORGANISM="Florenciella parvula, Strain CCMP2471" /LENGTH=61 /DNA_ID=CAMNT_0007515695 /DNA_START=358 /DNA_END=540 /DNA_ORIENTATION=+